MNKKQLIGKYKNLEGVWDAEGAELARRIFLQDLEQLDEPQKPVVPQFVADWIEYCKFTNVNLQYALLVGDVYFYNYANQKDFSKLKEFLDTENDQETFAQAWLDGYEVEKEKRYLVKMKGMQKDCVALKKNKDGGYWYLSDTYPYGSTINIHTRKELEEAGFGWVFDCEGIEIKEVE